MASKFFPPLLLADIAWVPMDVGCFLYRHAKCLPACAHEPCIFGSDGMLCSLSPDIAGRGLVVGSDPTKIVKKVAFCGLYSCGSGRVDLSRLR